MTSALPGLLFSAALAAFLIWSVRDDWKTGRLLLRGTTVIKRGRQPGQFYFGIGYKLVILALSLLGFGFCAGRLLSWW